MACLAVFSAITSPGINLQFSQRNPQPKPVKTKEKLNKKIFFGILKHAKKKCNSWFEIFFLSNIKVDTFVKNTFIVIFGLIFCQTNKQNCRLFPEIALSNSLEIVIYLAVVYISFTRVINFTFLLFR